MPAVMGHGQLWWWGATHEESKRTHIKYAFDCLILYSYYVGFHSV